MTARSFCTVDASTKRNEALAGNRRGAPIANLASILITPLWPASQETVSALDLNSAREFKECFHVPASGASLPDVIEGDVLTVSGTDYRIDHVAEWTEITDGDVPTLHIVVQEVKGS